LRLEAFSENLPFLMPFKIRLIFLWIALKNEPFSLMPFIKKFILFFEK